MWSSVETPTADLADCTFKAIRLEQNEGKTIDNRTSAQYTSLLDRNGFFMKAQEGSRNAGGERTL
jgi:hypothetical protein